MREKSLYRTEKMALRYRVSDIKLQNVVNLCDSLKITYLVDLHLLSAGYEFGDYLGHLCDQLTMLSKIGEIYTVELSF